MNPLFQNTFFLWVFHKHQIKFLLCLRYYFYWLILNDFLLKNIKLRLLYLLDIEFLNSWSKYFQDFLNPFSLFLIMKLIITIFIIKKIKHHARIYADDLVYLCFYKFLSNKLHIHRHILYWVILYLYIHRI